MDGAPRILRFADAERMPWRNGGGETAELAVHPPGSAPGAFGWRVSLAAITREGPFSTFRGVDRAFAVVDGGDAVLTVGAGPPARLGPDDEALRFAGEAPCRCGLPGGPARALNVMTARGAFACAVSRLRAAGPRLRAGGATVLLVCAGGGLGTGLGPLEPLDALLLPPGAEVGLGAGDGRARAVLVSIWRTGGRGPAPPLTPAA